MTTTPTTAGLLHTVASLATVFDGMLDPLVPRSVRRVHVVDPWLLATARRDGVTRGVHTAVEAHVAHLERSGADAVLVTCSSIGEAADAAGATVGIPVLRVDAPMAADAVRIAAAGRGRIAVLATLTSTLGPTTRLVERAAASAGCTVELSSRVVAGAAEAADAGDRVRVEALVAAAVSAAADDADVIVLAQASMAPAAHGAAITTPVLSSPEGGVRALAAALGTEHLL